MAISPWVPIAWFLLPFLNFSVTKLLSYLDFHLSRKLDELRFIIIPSLKQMLGQLTEQRMLRGAKDEGEESESDLETLGQLEKKLKFALYDAEDVLDLVKYREIEKTVICRDGKSQGTSISSRVLQAISNWIACCKQSSLGQKLWLCTQNLNQKLRYLGEKLLQCAMDLDLKFWELVAKIQNLKQMFSDLPLRATLVQCAQSLHQYIHQGAAGQTSMPDVPGARSTAEDDIEQGTTPDEDAPSNPTSPNAVPNSASQGTSIGSRILQAIGDWMACCKPSSFGQKLWQCAKNQIQKLRYLGDKLQQFGVDLDLKFWETVAKIHQYIHQVAVGQTSTQYAPATRSAAQDDTEQATMPSPTSTKDAPAARSAAQDDTQQATMPSPTSTQDTPDARSAAQDDTEQAAMPSPTSTQDAPDARSAAQDGTEQAAMPSPTSLQDAPDARSAAQDDTEQATMPSPTSTQDAPGSRSAAQDDTQQATMPSPTSTQDAPGARSAAKDDTQQATMPSPTSTQDMPGARSAAQDDPEQATMPDDANAVPNSAGSAAEFSGDNQHGSDQAPALDHAPTNALVQITWDCFGVVFALLCSFCAAVLHLRDWSWEAVGIMNDDNTATEWVLSINEIINLRKRIKNIEYTISDSKESPLLNQKDADKESSSNTSKDTKESTSTLKEIDDVYRSIDKKVFGREEDCADIRRKLREGPATNAASSSTSKPYFVIGIYGITGSGKSTLAQYVCDSEKCAGYFNPIMFVYVGKIFSVRDIFREMLDQIKQQQACNTEDPKILKTELKDLKSLKAELKKELKGKRFLLVLDDLWVNAANEKERKECKILHDLLRVGQRGSRILVTAQKKDAAAALGAQEQIPIPDLEKEQYLKMFMHYALEDSQVTSSDDIRYKEIGSKIAQKLRRSPIAAVTVAARLKSKSSIDFWETTSNLDVLDETMGALWWSYQQLGVDIRRCFTYCSTFPRGSVFDRDALVDIWIAQGFVNSRTDKDKLESVGLLYIEELLKFSFLQVPRSTNFSSEPKKFIIHDLLHELGERVSGSDFFRIGFNGSPSPKDIPREVRHLFVGTENISKITEEIMNLENLRTLIIKVIIKDRWLHFIKDQRNYDLEKLLDRLFTRMTKLQVLIITINCGIYELSVPASIGQMKHLRYLRIHFFDRLTDLILPSTFSKLYHIQIIDIPCIQEASCPEDMANLEYLRHISPPLCFPNIERLKSLQTLISFGVKEKEGYGLEQLKHLNKLGGTLSIKGLEIVGSEEQALEANLTAKVKLSRMELHFGLDSEKRYGPEVEAEVLEGLCPPNNLQGLHIAYYKGSCYPSWMLSRHHPEAPNQLQRLELCYCSSQLESIPEDSELFTGLRELWIYECDWDRLPENMERLVSLQALWIESCNKIEVLPTLPHQSLKTIGIYWCDVLIKTCNEEGHENWCKIQHIDVKDIELRRRVRVLTKRRTRSRRTETGQRGSGGQVSA